MNKSDMNSPVLTVVPASPPHLLPARRLIVLVPDSEADAVFTARKILELAKVLESHVLFLGLSKDEMHEPGVRRHLVTLSAMVGDGSVSVESKIEIGNDWLGVVKSEWHKGDVIVCFTEQRSGIARRPLSQILESNLNATVYVFDSLPRQKKSPRPTWMFDAMAWMGSIAIILGFFWMQSRLVQFSANWALSLLLYISIFAEAGSIWAWNSLFG